MNQEKEIPYRPLGIVTSVLESAGYGMAYVYEDLVFPDNNGFLLKMGESGADVSLHFNEEMNVDNRSSISDVLKHKGEEQGVRISPAECYRLVQNEEEKTIDILFAK